MHVNYDNEELFLQLVKDGRLIVNKDGTIYNPKTKRFLGESSGEKYRSIGWKIDGKVKHQLVHRLVFLVHGGVLTPEFPLVNHKDGDKSNNSFDNLEASNYFHNSKHAHEIGLHEWNEEKSRRRSTLQQGENGPKAFLNNTDVVKIFSMYSTGEYYYADLGKMFNTHRSNIGRIIRKETFQNLVL